MDFERDISSWKNDNQEGGGGGWSWGPFCNYRVLEMESKLLSWDMCANSAMVQKKGIELAIYLKKCCAQKFK